MKNRILKAGSSRSAFIIRLMGTLGAVTLLIYLLGQQGWSEIVSAATKVSLMDLLLTLVLMFVSRLAVTGRWYVLLRYSGMKISLGQSLRITFAGLFASNFLPTTIGGDVIRLAGAIQLKYDVAICTASLVVDRLVGMAGMVTALPFGLPSLFQFKTLPDGHFLNPSYLLASLSGSLQGGIWRKKIFSRIKSILFRIIQAISLWLKKPFSLVLALLLTWLHMICFFFIIFMLFNGMGDFVPLWLVAGLYSLVYFVTLLPFSINGYGLQEVSMTFVFSSLAGASLSSGLAVALLFRTLTMLASLPGVVFVPGLLPGAKKQAEISRDLDIG